MLLSKLDWQRHLSLYQTQKLRTQATGTPQRGCFPNLYTQPPSINNLQPMGKAPPVPPRVTQPIYDAEAKFYVQVLPYQISSPMLQSAPRTDTNGQVLLSQIPLHQLQSALKIKINGQVLVCQVQLQLQQPVHRTIHRSL